MTTVRLSCFCHPHQVESRPFSISRVKLFLWKLWPTILGGTVLKPKQFQRTHEYHFEIDRWLIERDATPTKEGIVYGMCPTCAGPLLDIINE